VDLHADEEHPDPMDATWLYYALSTIAQCAAALAELIGFLGLWRLDRLREEGHQCVLTLYRVMGDREFPSSEELIVKDAKDVIKNWDSLSSEQQTRVAHQRATARRLREELARRERLRTEQDRLMEVLQHFLRRTLVILGLAISGLVVADALAAWVVTRWLVRLLIILAAYRLWRDTYAVLRTAACFPSALPILAVGLFLVSPALAGEPGKATSAVSGW
jgi:hypothetical protein